MIQQDFFVVGIGASAGGYEALKDFFYHLPPHPGLAFVVVQHLSYDFKSLNGEILRSYTPLPIRTVVHDTDIQADCVYIVPDNKFLKIKNYRFYLEDRDVNETLNYSIDVFFHSLGNELKEKAIGIILSGMGADGANGVKTIHENGGAVMIQQPETAIFEDMPTIAILADDPDWVLPPIAMGAKLIEYIHNPRPIQHEEFKIDIQKEKTAIQAIIDLVSDYSKVNFKSYKINTLLRRIERRINIHHFDDAASYLAHLRKHTEEIHVLYSEMLINVTSFFRDPLAYEALIHKAIPAICQRKSYDPIRVWVPACATGEEAYSIAILIDEYLTKHSIEVDYKIFATDLDQRSIDMASYGRFRDVISHDVNSERLNQYFNQIGDFYEIKKDIRKKIIFAKHNLINDPPFIKLDLITCRNLFIYLKSEVQKKIISNFNYSLKSSGFLFLGANESPGEIEELFEPVDAKWKIFKHKGGSSFKHQTFDSGQMTLEQRSNALRAQMHTTTAVVDPTDKFAEMLISEYVPACIFVNQANEVVYINGDVEQYLQLPRKKTSFNLFNMVNDNLAVIFRNGIRKINMGNRQVSYKNITITKHDTQVKVNLTFKAMQPASVPSTGQTTTPPLILVEFINLVNQTAKELVVEGFPQDNFSEKEIKELERELSLVKRELQYTVDELETINEELQASNEEKLSSNEELQSSNEELQSSNEELFTVNTELKNKIDELTVLHNDITNLLSSSEIATIFLDRNLNIRRFTPSAKNHFSFLESDIGRPIHNLTHDFTEVDFVYDAKRVLQTLVPVEKEIQDKAGKYYLMRILLYKSDESSIQGVVITLMDISELKETNNKLTELTKHLQESAEELKKSGESWQSLVNNTPDIIARVDKRLKHTFVNEAITTELGISAADVLGRDSLEIGFPSRQNAPLLIRDLRKVLKTGKPAFHYTSMIRNDQTAYYSLRIVPEYGLDGQSVEHLLIIARDITQLKIIELELQKKNDDLLIINEYLDNFVHAAAHDLQSPVVHMKYLIQLFKDSPRESQVEFVDKIRSEVHMLEKILNGLVELIKVRNMKFNSKRLSLEATFQNVKSEFSIPLQTIQALIQTNFASCPFIQYTEAYLQSILRNLLSNAIKYRKEDQPLEVTITTHQDDAYTVLTFQDNGHGIDLSKFSKKLFQPFTRLTNKSSGIGIGLHIIKFMVEKNGGRIEVQSKENQGTTFMIYLKEYPDSRQ